jgi:Matrixin/Repeat of unknown function (DUF5648)
MKLASRPHFSRIAALALAAALAAPAMNASAVATDDRTDFQVVQDSADGQKFLTYGWNGWANKTVRWRYNDANRPAAVSASSAAMLTSVRAAMDKWSAVCAVTFVYDGETTNGASLANNATRDAINTISWGTLASGVAGLTYVGTSNGSASPPTLEEADMVINVAQGLTGLEALLLHEVGHMLGLKHSNIENAVMSGPNTAPDPSTNYSPLTALAADDIAGCRSLYGVAAPISSDTTVAVSATSLNFADTLINGVSNTQIVGVINKGASLLTVSAVKLTGDDYILISTTCSASTPISANGRCGATVRFAPKTLGARTGTLEFTHNATSGTAAVALSGNGVNAAGETALKREMIEYRFDALDYYFLTSRDADKLTLDATSGWARTGERFYVFATQGSGTLGINRFYFDKVALNATRGTHFYTLQASEVTALASLNPSNANTPGLPQSEGTDAYAYAPLVPGVGGSCASGLVPVYRLFRGAVRFPDNPNHRFTTSVATYNSFVALGWDGEGVNFCVPSN